MTDLKPLFPNSNILYQSAGKKVSKKGNSYLCITNDNDDIKCISIHFISKERDNLRHKQFQLKELSAIDGQDSQNDFCLTFHFEKTYKWIFESYHEKMEFVECLFMLTHSNDECPDFLNLDEIIDEIKKSSTDRIRKRTDYKLSKADSIVGLTEEQNEDLLNLFSNFDEDIINAESFLEKIIDSVSVLDSENSYEILNSQDLIKNLLTQFDNCISKIDEFDGELEKYGESIDMLCKRIEAKKKAEYERQLSYNNKQRLYDFLDYFIKKLSLDPEHVNALIEDKLRDGFGINKCITATNALQECLTVDIPESLRSIQAVREQMNVLQTHKEIFVKRFFGKINGIFHEQATELHEKISEKHYLLSEIHFVQHSELLNYTDLMLWVKSVDMPIFNDIIQIYTKTMKPIYQGQIKNLVEFVKNSILCIISGTNINQTSSPTIKNLSYRSGTLNLQNDGFSTIGQYTSHDFNDTLDRLLDAVEEMCFCELNFCCNFFDGIQDDPQCKHEDLPTDNIKLKNYFSLLDKSPFSKTLMVDMFSILTQQFSQLVDFTGKHSMTLSLNMFVLFSTRMVLYSKSFTEILGLPKLLITTKRLFDQFIEEKVKSYKEYKLSKKKNLGIVPHIADFYSFAGMAKSLMTSYSERIEVLKAFNRLVESVFEFIEQTAIEQPKTARQHLVRLENYHRLLDVLKKLKIKNLDVETKEAKTRYDNSRNAYIEVLMETPLFKINEFLKAICARIDVGVKMDDISYELAFSKREARKLIKDYQSKKVFESLEHVYRKVERQISKDANLLPVIWSFIREEFVRQFHSINNLFKDCYADSSIVLQFSIDDVTKFFDTFF